MSDSVAARLRDVLSDELCVLLENSPSYDVTRKLVHSALLPLLSSLLEEREREIREAVERLVKKATEPVTFMDAYRCSVCGALFHPPQVHTAHPWCPVYNLQELVLPRLASSSSPAAPQNEPT